MSDASSPAGPDWLAVLRAHADQPPQRPRQSLRLASAHAAIGSIEPALGERLHAAGLLAGDAVGAWVVGDTEGLAQVARWLHLEGLAARWRDELLDVIDPTGRVLAAVERAAVRPLGITTQAVHLVGRSPAGGFWVQQRALDKATDPGLWDTLMGGLISAGEGVAQTLARETWEEAGLHVGQLDGVAPFGRITVRRPVREGYMVEHIHMFGATVPEGMVPANQDGEVQRFDCLGRAELIERLQAGAFTLEAALILAAALQPL